MKVTGNVKYIPAGTTQYIVDGSDGEINVDASLSAITIILPNIINSGYTNSDKGFIINDISGNAGTNNITITAINNTVNSQSSILISSNGGTAKCSIASMNEWFAVTEPSTGGMTGNLTPNYIPQAATSSTLNDSVIYQNGTRIGVGTINPSTNFHVNGTTAAAIITSSRYSSDINPGGFAGAKARGTESSPSGVLFRDSLMTIGAFGYTSGGAFSDAVGKMVFYTAEDFTASANGTSFKISTTPIGATVDVFNFGISSNGDVSIGDILLSPTARLHVKGVSATSSDFAFKADNLSASPLLYVRNDGVTLFNNSAFINNSISPFQSLLAGDYLGTLNNNLNILAGISTPSSNTVRISYYGNTQWLTALSIQNSGASFGNLILMPDGGNVGIGTIAPTATIHGKGIDATSSNYALKVDNSASSALLYVRNDGNVYSHGFGGISSNTSFGLDSLIAVSGLYNSAFGTNSLKANSTGTGNCAFGFESLKVNTSGDYSTSIGTQALYSNTIGASNTAIGNAAMALNVSGTANTAIGKSALYNSTINGNTAIGNQSLQTLSTGSNNTAIGNQSGLNATGSGSVFIGYLAGASETGSNKLFIDNQARTNEATARVESLIYGIFGATTANQVLTINAAKLQTPYLQTGNAGLTTGDMYVDTAANILANGDKVVGWKV